MAWLISCDSNNWIPYEGQDFADPFFYLSGTVGMGGVADLKKAYRHRTITGGEYVGVDYTTASNYVSNNPSTTSYSNGVTTTTRVRYARDGEGGAYKVILETETISDFAELT